METPLESVVCDRGFSAGHGRNTVVARREPEDPSGFTIRTHKKGLMQQFFPTQVKVQE